MAFNHALPVRVCAILLALPLVGCDSQFSARVEGDYHFSLYGVFNPRSDTQAVLVFPVQANLEEIPRNLAVEVTAEEVESGRLHPWSDSLIQSSQGLVHVFWSEFAPAYGSEYRLTVSSTADDRSSEVSVHVPGLSSVEVMPPVRQAYLTQDLLVGPDVSNLNSVVVRYVVEAKLPAAWRVYPTVVPSSDDLEPVTPPPGDSLVVQRMFVPIAYDAFVEPRGSGMAIVVNYHRDASEIWTRLERRGRRDREYGVRLIDIEVSMIVSSPDWRPPGGSFDPEALVQPGAMSNVVRGFGFVGAGYRLRTPLGLGREDQESLGFRVDG